MKKYFIFSDVHSFYDELMLALTEKGFDIDNKDHIIISCGDLFDRGSKSKECLAFITSMLKQNRALCVKGNHEELLEDIFERGNYKSHDFHNGTDKTITQLSSFDPLDELDMRSDLDLIEEVSKNEDLKYYLDNCKDFHEVGDNIFVHGWIPFKLEYGDDPQGLDDKYVYLDNWRKANYEHWFEARWVNGMKRWYDGIREPGKTIYCGHWNCSYGNANFHNDGVERLKMIETYWIDPKTGKQEPHVNNNSFKDDGIVALDATTVLSHKVNVEIIEI